MTPEERKAASEELLRRRGIPVNPWLPCIEPEEDVCLRSHPELLHRLVALWTVAGTAFLRGTHFRTYVTTRKIESWLSSREREFLLGDDRRESDYVQYSWRTECLYFLAWCAGLIETIDVPTRESSVEPLMHLFPADMEAPDRLSEAIRPRNRSEIVAWADLLYRLHWAVRDARLRHQPAPDSLNGDVIQEWHLAVNWMTRYDDQDDWDRVATDT